MNNVRCKCNAPIVGGRLSGLGFNTFKDAFWNKEVCSRSLKQLGLPLHLQSSLYCLGGYRNDNYQPWCLLCSRYLRFKPLYYMVSSSLFTDQGTELPQG